MKKIYLLPFAAFLCLSIAACSAPAIAGADIPTGKVIKDENNISLTKVSDHAWVCVTWQDYEGNPTPANAMLIATSDGFVLVDTPWTDEQTKALLHLIDKQFGKKVTLALFTHAHADRIGGIKALQDQGIRCISTALTAEQAFAKPEAAIAADSQMFTVGGVQFEAFYPGKGHTADNITVWIPADKVLFGGCFIKSADAVSLGSITDADVDSWPDALEKEKKAYPDITTVIPGHGAWGGQELIDNTVKLFQ